jgi:hypothetical protein
MEFPSYKFRRAQLLESREITVAQAKHKLQGFITSHNSRYAEIATSAQVLKAIEDDCWMNVPGNLKGERFGIVLHSNVLLMQTKTMAEENYRSQTFREIYCS